MMVERHNLQTSAKRLMFCVCCLTLMMACKQNAVPKNPQDAQPLVDAYEEAKKRVEENRGEAFGRKAQVKIPAQLQHYADRRRFLAIQYAAWNSLHNEIPRGYLELLELILKGGLVEMEKVGDDYLLYGVGEMADTQAFSYYDAASDENITLYENSVEFEKAQKELTASINQLQTRIADLQTQTSLTADRALKNRLAAQLKENDDKLAEITLKKNLEDLFYKDPVRRAMLFARFSWLANIAANFKGASYDLKNPAERRAFKMRLLSFIRPEARTMILQIAATYKEKFARHLPITSLIRTVQYQRQLRETNANAANVEIPPHTTGLAFDVFDGWMIAEEQDFLMNVIAKLETAGRLEALRENRDHIHIFAFANGKPPDENRIAQALK
jgi:hypothetical protein